MRDIEGVTDEIRAAILAEFANGLREGGSVFISYELAPSSCTEGCFFSQSGRAEDGIGEMVEAPEELSTLIHRLNHLTATSVKERWNKIEVSVDSALQFHFNCWWDEQEAKELDDAESEFEASDPDYQRPKWRWQMTPQELLEDRVSRLAAEPFYYADKRKTAYPVGFTIEVEENEIKAMSFFHSDPDAPSMENFTIFDTLIWAAEDIVYAFSQMPIPVTGWKKLTVTLPDWTRYETEFEY